MPHRGLPAYAMRAALLAASLLALASCARPAGPPPIRLGAPCVACGMEIQDLRFACERGAGSEWRVYDSIECLLREPARGGAWLADYDSRALHAADSMWVVRGDFPSPMGGGLAAFLDRSAADQVAARTRGRVDRLAGIQADPR
jgi:nitrous oxide reductase accessory protein NosL